MGVDSSQTGEWRTQGRHWQRGRPGTHDHALHSLRNAFLRPRLPQAVRPRLPQVVRPRLAQFVEHGPMVSPRHAYDAESLGQLQSAWPGHYLMQAALLLDRHHEEDFNCLSQVKKGIDVQRPAEALASQVGLQVLAGR
jgi:hypothetical protein